MENDNEPKCTIAEDEFIQIGKTFTEHLKHLLVKNKFYEEAALIKYLEDKVKQPARKNSHAISDEQIKSLVRILDAASPGSAINVREIRDTLKAWFPSAEVFQREKTYRIGHRFTYDVSDRRTLVINQVSGNRVCINTTHGHLFSGPFEVDNIHRITVGEIVEAVGPSYDAMISID